MPGDRHKAIVVIGCLLLSAPLAADEAPSAELLEFLGTFETAKGRWIDPTQLPAPLPPAGAPEGAKEKSNED